MYFVLYIFLNYFNSLCLFNHEHILFISDLVSLIMKRLMICSILVSALQAFKVWMWPYWRTDFYLLKQESDPQRWVKATVKVWLKVLSKMCSTKYSLNIWSTTYARKYGAKKSTIKYVEQYIYHKQLCLIKGKSIYEATPSLNLSCCFGLSQKHLICQGLESFEV